MTSRVTSDRTSRATSGQTSRVTSGRTSRATSPATRCATSRGRAREETVEAASWSNAEVARLAYEVERARGYDLRRHPAAALRARLQEFGRSIGAATSDELGEALLSDDSTFEQLLLDLSAGPVTLFDDPGFYRAFRADVVPMLATYPSIRVWVPGCSTGESAWSLAAVLAEAGLAGRARVYATDPSELALERARAGAYPVALLSGWRAAYRAAGGQGSLASHVVVRDGAAVVRPALASIVHFARHDPAVDGTFNEFHAIVCRDILTRYRTATRETIHARFLESLVHLGFLCLGRGDAPPEGNARHAYVEYVGSQRIYRRIGGAAFEAVRSRAAAEMR